jgi:DNA-binding response OmpR family regulator
MSQKQSTNKKKILLVEDDDAMRRFLEIVLQRAHYNVILAEDGLAAMEVAFDTSIDAVVSDAVMPHMTGHDLCRILRQSDEMKNVPIVILSGLEQEETDSKDCLADAYLLKSSNVNEELVNKLTELFGEKSNLRQSSNKLNVPSHRK